MERITSRRNAIVAQFRAAAAALDERVLLDGAHLLEEALSCGVQVELVALHERDDEGPMADLAGRAARAGARLLRVSDNVLSAISPVRKPSGLVAIARRRAATLGEALEHPPQLVLLLSDVQDPGNVGATIRVADGCGATGIVTGERTADPFGWKALRGSMGSAFRVPLAIRQPIESAVRAARDRRIRVVAAVPRGGTPLSRCDLRESCAILLGGEGGGIPPALLALADDRVTVPMRHPVESLNVAIAAALILYESMRQREETGRDRAG